MSQSDIVDLLENKRTEWLCAKDICNELGACNINSITLALKKLLSSGEIKAKIIEKYKTNKKTKYYQLV